MSASSTGCRPGFARRSSTRSPTVSELVWRPTRPVAERAFGDAAERLLELSPPFHAAVVELEHGEWLTAQGRADEAEDVLGRARETFERLQARPWLDRVDAVSARAQARVTA